MSENLFYEAHHPNVPPRQTLWLDQFLIHFPCVFNLLVLCIPKIIFLKVAATVLEGAIRMCSVPSRPECKDTPPSTMQCNTVGLSWFLL